MLNCALQFAEGQRKANFEECDAKKRESAERISRLKREVKELQLEFSKAKNVLSLIFGRTYVSRTVCEACTLQTTATMFLRL